MTPPPDSGDISQAELRRWLARIEAHQGQMVTQAIWQMQQQHTQQQLTDMRGEISSLRSDLKAEQTKALSDIKLESQTKGAQRWQVWMAILTGVISLIVAVLLLVWSR